MPPCSREHAHTAQLLRREPFSVVESGKHCACHCRCSRSHFRLVSQTVRVNLADDGTVADVNYFGAEGYNSASTIDMYQASTNERSFGFEGECPARSSSALAHAGSLQATALTPCRPDHSVPNRITSCTYTRSLRIRICISVASTVCLHCILSSVTLHSALGITIDSCFCTCDFVDAHCQRLPSV